MLIRAQKKSWRVLGKQQLVARLRAKGHKPKNLRQLYKEEIHEWIKDNLSAEQQAELDTDVVREPIDVIEAHRFVAYRQRISGNRLSAALTFDLLPYLNTISSSHGVLSVQELDELEKGAREILAAIAQVRTTDAIDDAFANFYPEIEV